MKNVVRFKGLTLSRDELAVENGELALCGGVELDNGALRASVVKGEEKVKLDYGEKLLYVHKTSDPDVREVYITENTTAGVLCCWVGGVQNPICTLSAIGGAVVSINSIGNTLVIIGASGVYYALYKPDGDEYLFLGDKPEFIDIRFRAKKTEEADYYPKDGLEDSLKVSVSTALAKANVSAGTLFDSANKVKEEYQDYVTNLVWSLMNRTNSAITERNRFYAPFFVRYCYRMYDGTTYMHSAPVMVLVAEKDAEQVFMIPREQDDPNFSIPYWQTYGTRTIKLKAGAWFAYIPMNAALEFSVKSGAETLGSLSNWKDIITSVDVYISQPLWNKNSGALIKELTSNTKDTFFTANGELKSYKTFVENAITNQNVVIPRYSEKENQDTNVSTFFKVCSWSVDSLIGQTGKFPMSGYQELPLEDMVLSTLTAREQMKDDYKSHNTLKADGQFVYNKRVNLYGLREELFEGFGLGNLCSAASDSYNVTIDKIQVLIQTNDGEKNVVTEFDEVQVSRGVLRRSPLWYPDARAKMMKLHATNGQIIEFQMKEAPALNGSWTDTSTEKSEGTSWKTGIDNEVTMPSKIYTSEVDNPYYFPIGAINTVGLGEIKGLAATTRALSQGQFGQFPLLAFSTDGVWALNVSSTGTYSSIHPVSREVCVNPDSILQLDQSVLFATQRSLSRIVESDVESLSDMLDGPYDSVMVAIAKILVNGQEDDYAKFDILPSDFFAEATGVYDFINSRALFFNDKNNELRDIVMVLSLKDRTWSTMKVAGWQKVVNGYPYPYVQYSNGKVEELNKKYDYVDDTDYTGLLVTRTLTFDGLIKYVQGWEHVTEGDVQMVIFGSNELKNGWRCCGTSSRKIADYLPGHPFKYYRVGLKLRLKTSEKYSHLILDVKEKYGHQ